MLFNQPCVSCGAAVPHGAAWCPRCLAPVGADTVPEPTSDTMGAAPQQEPPGRCGAATPIPQERPAPPSQPPVARTDSEPLDEMNAAKPLGDNTVNPQSMGVEDWAARLAESEGAGDKRPMSAFSGKGARIGLMFGGAIAVILVMLFGIWVLTLLGF
jgi:hypothetical protein